MNPIMTAPPVVPSTPQMILKVSESLDKVEVVITPDQAARLLDRHNNHNRPFKKAAIAKYARLMRNGAWGDCADQIVFDIKGQLANGQNRLQAVVKSGLPQKFDVKFNAPVDIRQRCDMGCKRTTRDRLKLLGYDVTSSTTSIIYAIVAQKYGNAVPEEFEEPYYLRFQEALEFAEGFQFSQEIKYASYKAAIACAWMHLKSKEEVARLVRFVEIMNGHVEGWECNGVREKEVYSWRKAIIANKEDWQQFVRGQTGRVPVLRRFQYLIKCFVTRRPGPKFTKGSRRETLDKVFPAYEVYPADTSGIDD